MRFESAAEESRNFRKPSLALSSRDWTGLRVAGALRPVPGFFTGAGGTADMSFALLEEPLRTFKEDENEQDYCQMLLVLESGRRQG